MLSSSVACSNISPFSPATHMQPQARESALHPSTTCARATPLGTASGHVQRHCTCGAPLTLPACLPPRPPSPRLPLLPSPALATCRSGAWVATRAQPRAHSAASKLAVSHRGGAHTRHSVDHALHAPQRRLKLASSASHSGAATLRPVVERRRRQHAKVTNGDRRLPFETSLGGAALTTLAARVRRLPRLHALDHRERPRCRRRLGRRA